jgi:hypothetical protein
MSGLVILIKAAANERLGDSGRYTVANVRYLSRTVVDRCSFLFYSAAKVKIYFILICVLENLNSIILDCVYQPA